MFIDLHCHLDSLDEIDKVIARARRKRVRTVLTVGVSVETNRKAIALAERFEEVKAAMGLYPSEAVKLSDDKVDKEIRFIQENVKNIIAISEVGMDLKELDSLDRQSEIFSKFVELANELDKPIIVHSRKAEKECIEILEKLKARKVVMHCFSGNFKLVKRIVENKWHLTVPTCVKHSEHFQRVALDVPLDQLFCESDAPYLHPDKKFPNEPANVVTSYKIIARIKNLDIKAVESKIERNYKILFDGKS